ncbi:mitochondrial ribosomal protein L37, putative [Plasmodium ovale curtisi]|uniref:Mitochondrial ribosomal protein L37, putative n=1 Tax=Plasmodium ovale curtisi TaxID=864141 RepID=A0A1A8VWB4_PLAOA|nr:mitochondrial ribosomal protein L37, putative [Plasmodium ovale curtisi]SBS91162.1 mitochondrial ribosomal protein L37, putative [Plasmodium ovale curtisi]
MMFPFDQKAKALPLSRIAPLRGSWKSAFTVFVRTLFLSRGQLAPKAKPGKKGQAKKEAGSTTTTESSEKVHIFNIYNTVDKDHDILPDSAYPKWLWKLEKPLKSYGELALMFLYGKVTQQELNKAQQHATKKVQALYRQAHFLGSLNRVSKKSDGKL